MLNLSWFANGPLTLKLAVCLSKPPARVPRSCCESNARKINQKYDEINLVKFLKSIINLSSTNSNYLFYVFNLSSYLGFALE